MFLLWLLLVHQSLQISLVIAKIIILVLSLVSFPVPSPGLNGFILVSYPRYNGFLPVPYMQQCLIVSGEIKENRWVLFTSCSDHIFFSPVFPVECLVEFVEKSLARRCTHATVPVASTDTTLSYQLMFSLPQFACYSR